MSASQIITVEERFNASYDDVLLHALSGHQFTYGQFLKYALTISTTWGELGVTRGDKVALILPNSPAVLACYLACIFGGFTAVPINPDLNQKDQNRLLQMTHPTLVVSDPPVYVEQSGATNQKILPPPDNRDVPVAIMCTSGTTGEPKGICVQLNRLIGSAQSFSRIANMNQQTRMYHVLPMFYNAGLLNAFLAPVMAGGTIIEGPQFSLLTMLDFWKRPKDCFANFLCVTPTIATALCHLARTGDGITNIEHVFQNIISSGNILNDKTRSIFRQTFGVSLQDCYGVTELGGPLTLQTKVDAETRDDAGYILPGVEYELREVFDNSFELWVKSPYMMYGYLDGTNISLPTDDRGYMSTEDLAEIKDNRLQIIGRIKDVIIRGGENIFPSIIESELCNVPGVKEVAVIGEPHEFWGESTTACILPEENVDHDSIIIDIRNHAARNMSSLYRPDRLVVIKDFPRSAIGKVQKKLLRSRLSKYIVH